MKKFLCMISVLAFSISANAQDSGALFPELQKREQKQQAVQKFDPNAPVPDIFDTNTSTQLQSEKDRLEQLKRENILSNTIEQQINRDASTAQKRKVKKGQENFFIITPDEVQVITPAVSRFQFCRASLTLQNNTKHNIRALKITADYSPVQMPLTFGATPAGESFSGRFFLAGTSCEKLTGTPKITIDVCQAEGMSVEECKASVKYITDLRLASESSI